MFRLARLIDEDPDHLLEYQDLSKKELLVQSNGQKAKTVSNEFNSSEEESDHEFFESSKITKATQIGLPPRKRQAKRSRPNCAQALMDV